MDSDSDESNDNICPLCDRDFETVAGIKLHWARGHTADEIQAAIDQRLQHIVQPSVQPPAQPIRPTPVTVTTIRNRTTCRSCGFLAKNEKGLKVHERIHTQTITVQQQTEPHPDLDLQDEASVIQKFGEILYKCKCSVPMVRIIQKSVRTVVCQELTKTIELTATNNDVFSWLRLLCFPVIVLNTIPKTNSKKAQCPNIIRQNLAIFSKLTDVTGLFRELLNLLAVNLPKKPRSSSEKFLVKIAQRKVAEGDISGAIRVLSSQEGMAENTQETVDKLREKHPIEISPLDTDTEDNEEATFDTTVAEVVNSIKHFPISSSGGIDGLRPRHLKDLISLTCGDDATRLTIATTKLVNLIRAGKICEKMCPIFYGAALIALAKLNGDIRPIAIGLVWRRLAGKIGVFSIKDSMAELLTPIQNGFGIKGGAESIVHAVRTFIEASHGSPSAILKFDFKNAFNELFRKLLLKTIREKAPSLYPMLRQAYSCPSSLFFGDSIIESRRGTQQGDPCASVAFCLAIMKLTHSLQSRLNAWFADDGTIGDNFEAILTDVAAVLEFSTESGLTLNPSECEVYFLNTSPEEKTEMLEKLNHLLPGIKEIKDDSFNLLGSPMTTNGIPVALGKVLQNVKTLCKRLTLLDVHPALRLMRSSLSSPRFQHLLRCSPTFTHTQQLAEIDNFYRQTVESITNNELNDRAWTQASLPLTMAGIGIRKLTDLSHPAYFSSVHQSRALSNRILAKFNWDILNARVAEHIGSYNPEWIPVGPEKQRHQASWDTLRAKHIYDELLSCSDMIDRARLLASSSKTSSKWLQAIPSHQLGLMLDNDAARIAVALRLGTKVCEPHLCVCGKMVESNGHHGLSCTKMLGKYIRHHMINIILSMAFTAAGFPNTMEPVGLSRQDGKRPDGLTCYPWLNGRTLIWDVTIVDTLASSYVHLTSNNPGAAADLAERNKHNHYIDLKERYHFTPIAFESLGSVGPETDLFLRKLGKLMKRKSGEPRSLDFLLQRISIAIQRGNSLSIRNTFRDNCDTNVFL